MIENFQRDFGIRVLHAWGMTETSPLGTVSRLKAAMVDWPEERQLDVRLKQGIPVVGVETRILGRRRRGPPLGRRARRRAGRARPVDRVELLQQPRGRRRVHGRRLVPHRRHGEHRPLRLRPAQRPQEGPDQAQGRVDLQRGHGERRRSAIRACSRRPWSAGATRSATRCPPSSSSGATTRIIPSRPRTIIDLLARKFAKWQLPLPEDIHFVESLPKTGVGKIDKKVLRKMLGDQVQCPPV